MKVCSPQVWTCSSFRTKPPWRNVCYEEFGIALEEITQADYEVTADIIRDTQQWVREFKREHADELSCMRSSVVPVAERERGT